MANCILNKLRKKETSEYSTDAPLITITPKSSRDHSDTFNYDAYKFNTWISGSANLNGSSISFYIDDVVVATYHRGGAGQQGTEYPKVFVPKNKPLKIVTKCDWEMSTSLTFYKCPIINKGKKIIAI